MTIDVVASGLLTTIQDGGRPDHGHLGVPESGAADPVSFAIANALVGNEPGTAALEMTLDGGAYRVDAPLTVGLAGADLGVRVRGGRRLVPGRNHRLAVGEVLEVPGGPAGGCRLYLAVPGGFDVPVVLGSRSTCLTGMFGGLDGRPIRAGDRLEVLGTPGGAPAPPLDGAWPASSFDRTIGGPSVLRVIAVESGTTAALAERQWRVGTAADRVGIRLEPADDGPPDVRLGGEIVSQGVPWGAVQVPPDGHPIVLGPDHGTTGGYRIAGVVITADRRVLGQLAPGAEVRLQAVGRDAALAALHVERAVLEAGLAALRETARWDALARDAGA